MMQVPHARFEVKNRDGHVKCEFYGGGSSKGIVYMHGVRGGTHGPSNIYHRLAQDMQNVGISSLLIECRHDADLDSVTGSTAWG